MIPNGLLCELRIILERNRFAPADQIYLSPHPTLPYENMRWVEIVMGKSRFMRLLQYGDQLLCDEHHCLE